MIGMQHVQFCDVHGVWGPPKVHSRRDHMKGETRQIKYFSCSSQVSAESNFRHLQNQNQEDGVNLTRFDATRAFKITD